MALEALKTGEFPLLDVLIDAVGALPGGAARAFNAGLDIIGEFGSRTVGAVKNATAAAGSAISSGPSGSEVSPVRALEISAPGQSLGLGNGIIDCNMNDVGVQAGLPNLRTGGVGMGMGQ